MIAREKALRETESVRWILNSCEKISEEPSKEVP